MVTCCQRWVPKTEFSQLSKDISLLQGAMLLQICMRFEAVHRNVDKCGLEVFLAESTVHVVKNLLRIGPPLMPTCKL